MQIGVATDRAVDLRRIFVIHEDEIVSAALQFMLHDEIETHEIPSVESALTKAIEWPPAVILIGIGIIESQGVGILEEIKSKINGVKIIAVVEKATDPLAQDCLKRGANALLAKPLTIEKARQKVDVQLGRPVKVGIPVVVM